VRSSQDDGVDFAGIPGVAKLRLCLAYGTKDRLNMRIFGKLFSRNGSPGAPEPASRATSHSDGLQDMPSIASWTQPAVEDAPPLGDIARDFVTRLISASSAQDFAAAPARQAGDVEPHPVNLTATLLSTWRNYEPTARRAPAQTTRLPPGEVQHAVDAALIELLSGFAYDAPSQPADWRFICGVDAQQLVRLAAKRA
jgi:hypothetical protein